MFTIKFKRCENIGGWKRKKLSYSFSRNSVPYLVSHSNIILKNVLVNIFIKCNFKKVLLS